MGSSDLARIPPGHTEHDPPWESKGNKHRGRQSPRQPYVAGADGAKVVQATLAFMVVLGPMSCSKDISGGLLGRPSSSELMPPSSPRLAGRPPGGGGGPIFTLHCIFN